jgi:hypothetical protein
MFDAKYLQDLAKYAEKQNFNTKPKFPWIIFSKEMYLKMLEENLCENFTDEEINSNFFPFKRMKIRGFGICDCYIDRKYERI